MRQNRPAAWLLVLGGLLLLPAGLRGQGQPSRWLEAGGLALRQGHPQEAEADFRQELASAPDSADAYLGLGLAQLREGNADQAKASLGKSIDLNPSLPGAHLFRGIVEVQLNTIETALADFETEVSLQPKNAEALTWLGIANLQAGKPQQAATAFDRAGALRPQDQSLLYYQVRAHTMAAQQSFRQLFKDDADSAFVHRAQAEIYVEAQQPDKAIEEYHAALKRSPNDPELYEALGDALQTINRTAEATVAYESELKINPRSAIALFNLGKIQVQTGDPAQGVEYLRRAVEAHASPAPTDFYLGFGLAKLGKNEEAAHWLEQVLENSPSDFILQSDCYELGRIYQKLGRSADAHKMLDELKKLKSQSAPAKE
jgi:tetratricopeptide (TPR) repeat protein